MENKLFICEVKNVGESEYVIEFRDNDSGEVLDYKKEGCLDDCLIDLYEFERSCYDRFVNNSFDSIIVRIKDVEFGL